MTVISYVKSHVDRARDNALLATGNEYSLTLKNDSAQPWTFYVYQQMPKQSANVFSLAWFCSPFQINVGNKIGFTWNIDYGFIWSATGIIRPGVTFAASGDQLADLTDANTTTFSAGDAPGLSTPRLGEPKGSLVISDADNVPNNTFSVGISMSSAGTFVTNAGANLTHIFTPTPTYWIAAGINVKVGTVLDYTAVTRHKQVIFPSHTYALTYSLNQSNQWELVP